MGNLKAGRIDIVTPCHKAPFYVLTRTEGGPYLTHEVADEVCCSQDKCRNSWDEYGVASEWNTPSGDGHIDDLDEAEPQRD